MADNVLILGAGASAHAGAPVMNNFIERVEDILRSDLFGEDADGIRKVLDAYSQLERLYSYIDVDIRNLEVLYSVIDMAEILGKFGDLSYDEILIIRKYLDVMIAKTLEFCVHYTLEQSKNGFFPKPTFVYDEIVNHIRSGANTAIITFNYDLALDFSFSFKGININYCINEKPDDESVKLLKLHGSINWGKCSICEEIFPLNLQRVMDTYREEIINNLEANSFIMISDKLDLLVDEHKHDNFDKKNRAYEFSPTIVPPTWNKFSYNRILRNVWKTAAKELSEAVNIFVFGYSLPETDEFFKYLFALGVMSQRHLRRFNIYDMDPTVVQRYKNLTSSRLRDIISFTSGEIEPHVIRGLLKLL